MNKLFNFLAVVFLFTSAAQAYDLEGIGDFNSLLPARPTRPIRRPPIRPPLPPIPLCDVDPAAKKIDFQILYKTSQFRGKVRITGQIENIGRLRYTSNPNQQTVMLYEGTNLVASQNFQNLDVGQKVSVSYERLWDASSPSEGEFPPEYKILIIYDPDINLDSNRLNDDCRWSNNQLIRSGSGINALF